MMRPIALAAVALLAGQVAQASTWLLEVRGTVASRDALAPADWAPLVPGAPIRAQFIFDTQTGLLSGDGATFVALAGGGLRARLFVAGKPLDVEPRAFNGGQVLQSDSSNPNSMAGIPPGTDVLALAHVSFDDAAFFSDPTHPSAALRLIEPVFLAPGPSSLVASPVVSLGQGVTLAAAPVRLVFLFDGRALHPSPTSTDWAFGTGARAGLAIDTATLTRCERPLPWVINGAAWPKGEVDCR